MSSWTFLRLCVRAPLMRIDSMGRPVNIQQASFPAPCPSPVDTLAKAAWALRLLAATLAFAAFDWHHGLAGLGDDSVSYLIQAQLYSGSASDAVRAWAGTATHFPPLFPL